MMQEEKKLLLKDLSARLPYGVKVNLPLYGATTLTYDMVKLIDKDDNKWLPYLRTMSSMTEEEKKEISILLNYEFYIDEDCALVAEDNRHRIRLDLMQIYIDYLNAHHFDYRGLIPKGLAIAVTEENNPYKES